MKKLVLASAIVLASVAFVVAPTLRAQDQNQITIQNPTEFNAYQSAVTEPNPAAKASALEDFLVKYPNSVVKKAVLDQLIDTYERLNQPDKVLSASSRMLQLDPDNFKAIFATVYFKNSACEGNVNPATGDSKDPQTCNDAAVMARKGLALAKPANLSDADWKKMTDTAFPIFHSAIALDDLIAKFDYPDAIKEYTAALMLYAPQQTTSGPGLVDTLNLAEAYAKPSPSRDEIKAIWFFARAWNFAPAAYKNQIEPKLEYWYKRYHGSLDGLSQVKAQAAQTLFPPASFTISPAPTPVQVVHNVIATTPNLQTLNLEDKEFILANGSKADAQKLWSVLQDQLTPVPGIVISDPATVLLVHVTTAASPKPKDYTVKLNAPAPCSAIPRPPASDLRVADAREYLQNNGVPADVSAIEGLDRARKIAIEPAVTAINMAVTHDAQASHTADFIVNMKVPLACKQAPDPGTQLGLQPQAELNGTYDTYTTTPATATSLAKAQIVLQGGFLQPEVKAPVHHRARRRR